MEWELLPPPTGDDPAPDTDATTRGLDFAPPWMHIHPTSGLLTPGSTSEITFKVGVAGSAAFGLADPTTAEQLVNQPGDDSCSMSRTFILRVHGGADHFLVLDGIFVPSFFGLTVATLAERDVVALGVSGEGAGRFEMEGEGWDNVAEMPFVANKWDVIPSPLKTLLHFLARHGASFACCGSEAVTLAYQTRRPAHGQLPRYLLELGTLLWEDQRHTRTSRA